MRDRNALSRLAYTILARWSRWMRQRKLARISAGRHLRALHVARTTTSTGR